MRAHALVLGLVTSACGGVGWPDSHEEPIPLVATENRADLWTELSRPDNGEPYWLQTHVTGDERVCFAVPDGAVEVRVTLSGGAPHTQPYVHARLPETLPELSMACSGAVTAERDPSSSVVDYDTEHVISTTVGYPALDCRVCLTGEHGAGASASVLSLLSASSLH